MTASEPSTSLVTRGIAVPGHPFVLGTIVGAVGASVFVWMGASGLPAPWSGVVTAAWAVALAAYLWCTFVSLRELPRSPAVHKRAGLIYLVSVVGMIAAIQVGHLVLGALDRPDLGGSLTAVAVGLHFLPFARAFDARSFATLGRVVSAIGAAGLAVGWFAGAVANDLACALAGLGMLVLIARSAALPAHRQLRSEP